MYSHSKPHTWNEEPDIGNGYTNVYYIETVVHGLLCVSVRSRLTGDKHILNIIPGNRQNGIIHTCDHLCINQLFTTNQNFFIMGKISTKTQLV